MPQYRQGDVFLRSVPSIPEGAEKVKTKPVVLARGSATGHTHAIHSKATMLTHDGKRFIDVKKGAQLVHEEHSTIDLAPGAYEVVQQVEYTPEAVRNVLD